MATKVSYSKKAKGQLSELDKCVREYIVRSMIDLAQVSHRQMVVRGMTMNIPDHIYRAAKCYATSPSYRIIFYHENSREIMVDAVVARDCDPYQDGF